MSFFGGSTTNKTPEPVLGVEQDSTADIDIKALCRQIHIFVPHRKVEGVHPQLADLFTQWINAGMRVTRFEDPFGGFVELMRNAMAKKFLSEKGRRFMIMIDNDVVPLDPAAPILLARHDLPVVSGIACGFRPDVGLFACIAVKDKTGIARFPTAAETKIMPAEGIREIEACGTGVLCVRRDVMETVWSKEGPFSVPEMIRIECVAAGTLRKTEDICFSDRVREAGYKLYADFEVRCFHDKQIPLLWDDARIDKNLKAEDWDVTPFAMKMETD